MRFAVRLCVCACVSLWEWAPTPTHPFWLPMRERLLPCAVARPPFRCQCAVGVLLLRADVCARACVVSLSSSGHACSELCVASPLSLVGWYGCGFARHFGVCVFFPLLLLNRHPLPEGGALADFSCAFCFAGREQRIVGPHGDHTQRRGIAERTHRKKNLSEHIIIKRNASRIQHGTTTKKKVHRRCGMLVCVCVRVRVYAHVRLHCSN